MPDAIGTDVLPTLAAFNAEQIRRAGPRYTPGTTPGAPNIPIRSLRLSTSCLALDDAFRTHVRKLRRELAQQMRYTAPWLDRRAGGWVASPTVLLGALDDLAAADATSVSAAAEAVGRTTARLTRSLERLRMTLLAADRERMAQESELAGAGSGGPAPGAVAGRYDRRPPRTYHDRASDVSRLLRAFDAVVGFVTEPAGAVLHGRLLFLVGPWGTGKTHFLCDLVRERDASGLPTVFVLAQHVADGVDPLQTICAETGLADDPEGLFDALAALGSTVGGRALLIIDGVNEGDREAWRAAMKRLRVLSSSSPGVGVVMSCRMPFDEALAPPRVRRGWEVVTHPGFQDAEFDAQLEFFQFYGIPAPETPLLTPEFTRPLFLKVVCESLRALSRGRKRTYLRDLASGQKGMTKVLEDFVKHVAAPIEDAARVPRLTAWRLLTGC